METVLELLDLIYASVADASRWQTFLDALVRSTRAKRGAFALRDLNRDGYAAVCWSGWPSEDIKLYFEKYNAIDSWRAGSESLPEGTVSTDFELFPREEMESSIAFREFYAPRNCMHGMGGVILVTETGRSVVSLVRGGEDGPFGESEKAFLRVLMPHLRQAAILHGELGSTRSQLATFTGHLDRYPHAFLLIDAERRVLYANKAAREVSSQKDGLTIEAGRLSISHPRQDSEIQEALNTIISGTALSMRRLEISRPSRKMSYRLLLMPIESSGAIPLGVASAAVSVLIIDNETNRAPDLGFLRELFSLTTAEANVAGKLAQGLNVEEIAAEGGISAETVRTHIKRVLSKTSTNRQGELISLILRSAPFRP